MPTITTLVMAIYEYLFLYLYRKSPPVRCVVHHDWWTFCFLKNQYSNSVTVDPEISSDQFEQVAMEWFQAICPKVKESTSNKYRNLLSSYILPVFGSKQLRDITHEFIETQCNFFLVSGGLKENGLSSKTVSDILSLIRNVLQFATRNGKAISCDARSTWNSRP